MTDSKSAETNPQTRQELQSLMVVMAALAHGLEETLGRGAAPVTFRAGRSFGLREGSTDKTTELLEALDKVAAALRARGIVWPFEPWKPASAASLVYQKDGKRALRLVFRDCMVRCALFRYGHEQRQSLCLMNHGLFCGYLQSITGRKAELGILHAGENACLKELVIE